MICKEGLVSVSFLLCDRGPHLLYIQILSSSSSPQPCFRGFYQKSGSRLRVSGPKPAAGQALSSLVGSSSASTSFSFFFFSFLEQSLVCQIFNIQLAGSSALCMKRLMEAVRKGECQTVRAEGRGRVRLPHRVFS